MKGIIFHGSHKTRTTGKTHFKIASLSIDLENTFVSAKYFATDLSYLLVAVIYMVQRCATNMIHSEVGSYSLPP